MRTWLIIGSIIVVTIVYAIAVMFHMAVFRDKDVFFLYARSWSRILLRLSGIRVRLHGVEHLRAGTRYIYAANHASLFDIPVILATVPDNIRIMYKKELHRIPVFGWCLAMSPFIAVNRERKREASDALSETIKTLSTGSSVLIFPEGTRSDNGLPGQFRRGVARVAAGSKTSVVPLSVIGTASILPARTKRIRSGSVDIVVDAAMPTESLISGADEKEFVEKLKSVIERRVILPS